MSTVSEAPEVTPPPVASTPFQRLRLGQTAVDFWGNRRRWIIVSLVLLAVSAISLPTRWLNLGIEFEGGTSFNVPAGAEFDVDDARAVLDAEGITSTEVVHRRSPAGEVVKVQIEGTSDDVRASLHEALASRAGVTADEVSVSSVSSSSDSDLTGTTLIAIAVIVGVLLVVMIVRYEWRMAVAAIAAMIHDVVIAGGIYSVFGFEVSPATIVVFLAALGYSLYDSLVVFDRFRENERRIAAAGLDAADLVNVSTNQVATRSLVSSLGGLLPVAAVLVVGVLSGQATLRDFALAMFVAIALSAYSSLFVAAPLLGWLKGAGLGGSWLTGDELRHLVVRGVGVLAGRPRRGRRREPAAAVAATGAALSGQTVEATTEELLAHPPRPRKKKRH